MEPIAASLQTVVQVLQTRLVDEISARVVAEAALLEAQGEISQLRG